MCARKAGLAQLSDVALLKRLRKSSDWLHGLCVALFCERGLAVEPGLRVRAFDATTVREPGRTGSLWRVHYSRVAVFVALRFFRGDAGAGRGRRGISRGFRLARATAFWPTAAIRRRRGFAMCRRRATQPCGRNTGGLSLRTLDGAPFELLAAVSGLTSAGAVGSWPAATAGEVKVCGRICALPQVGGGRPPGRAGRRREAQRKRRGQAPACFCGLCHRLHHLLRKEVQRPRGLEWYRWMAGRTGLQTSPSLAQLGHLPKRDDESARAWLYGKLLMALLADQAVLMPRHFPLGDTTWRRPGPIVPGGSSDLRSTRSEGPSPPLASPARSTNGTILPKHSPRRRLQRTIPICKQVSAYARGGPSPVPDTAAAGGEQTEPPGAPVRAKAGRRLSASLRPG